MSTSSLFGPILGPDPTIFGPIFGPASESEPEPEPSSGPATTTARAIRAQIIRLIETRTPELLAGDRFRMYRNEGDGDFLEWCESIGAPAFRRFQVRDTGTDQPPDVSNTDVEGRRVTFEIIVAYPHDHRAGDENALDRDDIMSEDQHQIEHAIGMCGYANFNGVGSNPSASWVEGSTMRVIGGAIDFLVIRQTMRFYRAMS